jgi:hypothetical protein
LILFCECAVNRFASKISQIKRPARKPALQFVSANA